MFKKIAILVCCVFSLSIAQTMVDILKEEGWTEIQSKQFVPDFLIGTIIAVRGMTFKNDSIIDVATNLEGERIGNFHQDYIDLHGMHKVDNVIMGFDKEKIARVIIMTKEKQIIIHDIEKENPLYKVARYVFAIYEGDYYFVYYVK
jgi:hypothetical protein